MLLQTNTEIIVGLRVGKWHELAEAIRRGSLLLPQAFGRCFEKNGEGVNIGSCALGAAIMGGFPVPNAHLPSQPRGLCPSCVGTYGSILVQHLNDDHGWERERIADWLETL